MLDKENGQEYEYARTDALEERSPVMAIIK